MLPEAVFVLKEKRPMAVPVTVPSAFLTPANSLGVMSVVEPIWVRLLFQSCTQSNSTSFFPAAPARTTDQAKGTEKTMPSTVMGKDTEPDSCNSEVPP